MDKSMFEKYIQEMKAMQSAATLPIQKSPPSVPTVADNNGIERVESLPNSNDMTGMGRLIVSVTSVRGIYPVEGAKVTVFTQDGEQRKIIAELVTDRSGKTPIIELPAPSSVFTEAPDPSERPYAYYNIKTIADGFVDTYNYNVTVFDSVTSLQNVGLRPITTGVDGNKPIIINEYDNYTL